MIDTTGIKVGDRVKVTAKNDTAEFTVARTNSSGAIESARNYFSPDEWDTIEVIEPAPTPLPTKPGLYAPGASDTTRFLLLTKYGIWYWVDFTGSTHESVCGPCADPKAYADTIRPVYLYKGCAL